MVVVLIRFGGPPHGVLGVVIDNNILIFGGAAGVDAGHDVDGAQLADLAFFVANQTRLGFLFEKHLIRGIAHDLGGTRNAIFAQIQFRHKKYLIS